jgi:hypothetical protein
MELDNALEEVGVRIEQSSFRLSRLDAAVTLRFSKPAHGSALLTGIAWIDVPRCKPVVYGKPIETVEIMSASGRRVVARAYDWGFHRDEAERGRLIRMESQDRFLRARQPHAEAIEPDYARTCFRRRFESIRNVCDLTVVGFPLLVELMQRRFRDGELTAREYERVVGFLAAEATGLAETSYPRSTFYKRRAEMRGLGIAVGPGLLEPTKVDVREVLDQALDTGKWDCA